MARAAALLAAALVGACASVAPPGTPDALAGRLTVRVAPTDGQAARGQAAAFELRGDAERGALDLTSPLGTLVARALWAPGEARLQTAGGDERRYPTLEALAQDALGEPLPLAVLPAWLRGRAWPGAPSVALAPPAQGFEQLGWHVDLAGFSSEGLVVATRREPPPEVVLRARLERGAGGTAGSAPGAR